MSKKKATRFFSDKEKEEVGRAIWQAQIDLHADDYVISHRESKKDTLADETGDYIENAKILVNPTYLNAEITFSPNARKMFREDKDAFRRMLYHEVAHVIIDPLYLDRSSQLSPIEKKSLHNSGPRRSIRTLSALR